MVSTTTIAEQVHECLRYLADRCDYANSQDGVGFNGVDAQFGHSLAGQDTLTPAQVRIAAKMVRKYKKQLAGGGLEVPPQEDVEKYIEEAPRPAPPVRPIPQEKQEIENKIYLKGKRVFVECGYDADRVKAMQTLKVNETKWSFNKEGRKEWSYAVEVIERVLTVLNPWLDEFTIGEDIDAMVARMRHLAEIARQEAALEAQRLEEEKKAALATIQPYLDGEPLPNGQVLYQHQKEAIKHIIMTKGQDAERGAVLAHDMGLGKTLQALLIAKAYGLPTIVICPVSVMDAWRREAAAVEVEIEVWSWGKLPEPPETNYVLIGDECHYIQAGKRSQRGQAFLDLAEHARLVIGATGTPMKNGRPINLLPLLQAIKHHLAKDHREFERRYCAAKMKSIGRGKPEVYDVTGAAHLDELHKKIKGSVLYKKKKECLDLPEKTRVFREVEENAASRKIYAEMIAKLRDQHETNITRKRQNLEVAKAEVKVRLDAGEIDADEAAEELEELTDNSEDAESIVELGIMLHAGSFAKVEATLEIAQEVLEQDESIVLFTGFIETAQMLHDALKEFGAELLTGATAKKERQLMIDRFQEGKSRVFVSTVKAGGVGITLTAAQTVVLVDRPWTPGDATQAEDRIHRIGQNGNVTAIWLQYGDADRIVDTILLAKQERIELTLAGKRSTLRGIKSIRKAAKEILKAVKSGKSLDISQLEDEENDMPAPVQQPVADQPQVIETTLSLPSDPQSEEIPAPDPAATQEKAPQSPSETSQPQIEAPLEKKLRGKGKKEERLSEVYLQVAMTRQQRSAITSWVGNIKKTDPAMAAAILAEKNKGKIPSKRTTIIKDSDVVRYLLIQQPALAAILGGQKGEENED